MRTGLAAALAAMLVLPAVVILLAVYVFAQGAICTEVAVLLETTLRQKSMHLAQSLNDLEDDISAFASPPHYASLLNPAEGGVSREEAGGMLTSRFAEIRRIYGDRFLEFLVFDTTGRGVFPAGHSSSPVDIRSVLSSGRRAVISAGTDSSGAGPALWLYTPIGNTGSPGMGVLAARFHHRFLVNLFAEPPLGGSVKAYLVDLRRRAVFLLWSSQPETAGDAPHSEGVRRALAGETGVRQYRDSQGTDVVGAFTLLTSPEWGLVIEQEAAAAYSGLRRLRNQLAVVLGVLAAASIAFSLVAAGGIVRHLQRRDRRSAERSEQMIATDKLSTTGIMAASVAHEINNPLTTINVLIHNLCEETPPHLPQRMDLNIVLDEIAKIKNIILRFLEFARPQAPEFSEVRINQIVHRYCQLLRHQAAARGVELVEHPGNDVPPIVADAGQLGQVILNLVLNAIDATPAEGTIELSTTCSTRRTVCVRVFNTGVELPPDLYERVFEPFYTTKAQGTGLGLSIARMIVEQHGGSLAVAGIPGRGTEFVVTLPVQTKAAARG